MATREKRSTTQSQSDGALWPYRAGTALLASFVLLIVFLAILVALREAHELSSDRISAWLLLGVVLLSLVPVFLLVLERVAASAGTVETPGGVKISFARVELSARVDVARTTISANLGGTPGEDVAESPRAILQTLKPAIGSEVAVVDLGEGQEWWQTRLLVLVAGAARLGRPRALVFTATVSGEGGRFIAWATPRDLLRAHLQTANPRLQRAYRTGQANAAQWALGDLGEPTGTYMVTLPWTGPNNARATLAPRGTPTPHLIPEQFLLEELANAERNTDPPHSDPVPELAITVQVLHSLFTSVLRNESVERGDDDVRWRDAILDGTDDYLAVTDRGAYAALVSRQAAVNALLRSLLPDAAAPVPQTHGSRSREVG
jgi:hypothetical protein